MSDMYREQLLEHARSPRNYGRLEAGALTCHLANPSCGDVIDVFIRLDADQRIVEVSFTGQGCVISQAATSILLESVLGNRLDEAAGIDQARVLELLGVIPGPMRMNCALLPLKALQKIYVDYK
ncbi:MAG: iron-sulfur cluster assembly scaffold protein [Patescibacteria group bacterium]